MRADAILVNELQLGDSLNQAVTSARRSDFSLMLAMMVQDVRCASEFQIKKQANGEPLPLRTRLQLPDEAPLVEQYQQDKRAVRCAEAFQHSGLVQSRLEHCLGPEPLELRGEYPAGMQQALANAEPWSNKLSQLEVQPRPLPPALELADIIAQQRLQSASLQAVA